MENFFFLFQRCVLTTKGCVCVSLLKICDFVENSRASLEIPRISYFLILIHPEFRQTSRYLSSNNSRPPENSVFSPLFRAREAGSRNNKKSGAVKSTQRWTFLIFCAFTDMLMTHLSVRTYWDRDFWILESISVGFPIVLQPTLTTTDWKCKRRRFILRARKKFHHFLVCVTCTHLSPVIFSRHLGPPLRASRGESAFALRDSAFPLIVNVLIKT